MTTYIGTATSRVDGRAKVTGAAKYAGEFNTAGLAHASVVTSTIAKGRIARIDPSEALSVEGVIDVLTHQNRPPMASADSAYGDDVAPEGSPFRPLYDDRVLFSGQPIELAGDGVDRADDSRYLGIEAGARCAHIHPSGIGRRRHASILRRPPARIASRRSRETTRPIMTMSIGGAASGRRSTI